MICKQCNFENKDDAVVCANCGKPLTASSASDMKPMEEQEEKTTILEPMKAPASDDDGEANTTVLTNNMVNPVPAPQAPAPQGFTPAPMNGPKPVPPMGAPMNGGMPPMGGPKPVPPMGAPMNGGMPPMGGPKPSAPTGAPVNGGKAPKPGKAPKAAKPKKSKGTIAYIIISIILILGLAGVGVWGYFHFDGKLDEADKKIADKDAQIATLTADYDQQISDLNSEIDSLESETSSYQTQIADLNSQIQTMQSSNDEYAKYDNLLNFIKTNGVQGTSAFFASNNIVYLKSGKTADLKVYYADKEGTVTFTLANSAVATAEWNQEWENDDTTATLKLTAVAPGTTTLKLTNTTDNQEISILVVVE